ncbi:MAG TPA: hypothetical protein VFM67_09595 [Gaiella sp.]|jgi:hypothetical protein|nr:hypothetical protein [Gaiella sp.]
MAVSVVAHFPELSAELYDEVIASLDLDANPPAGAILHVAGEGDGSITTSEIWQTEQTFRAYLDYRLRPALRLHGVHRDPLVEVAPLHNVYAPEIFTIERMGSVSLPAHADGARF